MTRLNSIITGLAKLADTTQSEGVAYRGEDRTEKITPMNLLQDNTDEFVAIVQDLPEKAELKSSINHFNDAALGIEKYLTKISTELNAILEPGNDSKEIAKIKATSGLNEFADQLARYAKNFGELTELATTMKKLSLKHKEEEKHKPIRHKLRNKQEIKSPQPDQQDMSIDSLMNKS